MLLQRSREIGGRTLSIETGELAKQADGSVIVRYGETMVLVTAVMSQNKATLDYLPLYVDLVARTYSAGKIPGGYFKREGRPTESEILNSRLIDRPVRPLFPDGCRNEIQVTATVLSIDRENDPDTLGIVGASAALTLSDIPWNGPVAAVRVGRRNGEFVVNPLSPTDDLDLNLIVAVGREGIVMVEGEANFVAEDVLLEALMFAQKEAEPLLDLQEEMARELGITKREIELPVVDQELQGKVEALAADKLPQALAIKVKKERGNTIRKLLTAVIDQLTPDYPDRKGEIERYFDKLIKKIARDRLLAEGLRIDGRRETDIRPISCRTGIIPRAHGSALFTRGETQALVVATLGTAQDEQRIDALEGDVSKRFMLHYNFPPFSVGEVRGMRGPSRRDIGHGHLAERGTQRILPQHENFPYTIRIVSEILESNGSSSMATVCGTSLALMDAGVPTVGPVAGIAMGLIKEGGKFFILSDILGDEDHFGDMDFKLVGNEKGVSAVQMDIKISGLPKEVLHRALNQARDARVHILGKMTEELSEPRPNLSQYAPRVVTIMINPNRIKDLIGPGGKHIRAIIEETGVAIDVTNDGRVNVFATTQEAMDRAMHLINGHTAEAEVGKIYMGRVVKIMDFGAFIEILPGTEGLCHISDLSDRRVRAVEDVLSEGDEVLVKCTAVDKNGKVRLSRREAMKR